MDVYDVRDTVEKQVIEYEESDPDKSKNASCLLEFLNREYAEDLGYTGRWNIVK